MNLCVVSCLHGTEPYGLEVVQRLPASVPFCIGNPEALEKNIRYLESDLNRSFPGNSQGTYEERRACKILGELKQYHFVIDLHSSSHSCPLFGIITQPTLEKISFARRLGLKKLVIMPSFFASGKALIDFVPCGLSLEIGPHDRRENVDEVLECIYNVVCGGEESALMEIFEVVGVLKKEAQQVLIENFQNIHTGDLLAQDSEGEQRALSDFTAVLVNEEAYGNTLCLMCVKTEKYG